MQKVDFPWEIIIADDCSPDNTRNIINEYQAKHPDLIRLLYQDKNVGGGKNFVDLINSAQGKYIAYLEGDDYWTNDLKLQKQFDFMESHPEFSMCYHKIKWEFTYESDDWKNLPKESNLNDKFVSTISDIISKGWFIRSCSMFFKRIELPIGFELLYIGDYPLHVLCAYKGNIAFLNELMSVYRIHKNGFSEKNLIVDDLKKRFKNHNAEIEVLNFLNKHTSYKFNSLFKKKIFNEIYSFNYYLIKKNKFYFIKNIFKTIITNNPIFLFKNVLIKLY